MQKAHVWGGTESRQKGCFFTWDRSGCSVPTTRGLNKGQPRNRGRFILFNEFKCKIHLEKLKNFEQKDMYTVRHKIKYNNLELWHEVCEFRSFLSVGTVLTVASVTSFSAGQLCVVISESSADTASYRLQQSTILCYKKFQDSQCV